MGFSQDFGSSLEHQADNGVIVYSTSGCTRCEMLRKWLKNKETNFEEKNLEDVDVMTSLVMRNLIVMSAPAIEINGVVYTESQIFENSGIIKPNFSRIFEVE